MTGRIATGPVVWQQPEKPKRGHHILLALALLALIAVAGSRAWPVILDFWQTGVKPAVASHLEPSEWTKQAATPAETPASAPVEQPAPKIKPGTPAHAAAESKPASRDIPAAAVAPALSEATAETQASARPDAEPKPTAAAGAAQKHIDEYLASVDLTDAVQIHAAGDTLTLSGKLTSQEYRGLMGDLRDLPAGVRVIDHIEFASDSPENSAATPPRTSAAPPVAAQVAATPAAAATIPALTVTSQPAGANVFVNGQRQPTQTPAKINLPAGTYRIAITKPGFLPYTAPVEIRAGQPAHLDAELSPLAQGQGWVFARTVPRGASISVDGVATNQQTPARLDLAAGQHLILFTLAGYTAETSVVVRPGKGSQIFQVLNRP